VDFRRIKYYEPDELLFILSHECAHVYYNHIFPNIFWFIIEKLSKGKNNENGDFVDLFRIVTAILNKTIFGQFVPIDKAHIKRIELEADAFAVKHITYDLDLLETFV
jgi:Zn-dependent protease with chaperone function